MPSNSRTLSSARLIDFRRVAREAYTLHRAEEMRYGEIAMTMGTSVRTVETQILRARKAFRRTLVAWLT